jgi:hypothetical protein
MLYDHKILLFHLNSAVAREVTLTCDSHKDAKKLSFAFRHLRTNMLTVKISVKDNEVILTPRPLVKFEVKESQP